MSRDRAWRKSSRHQGSSRAHLACADGAAHQLLLSCCWQFNAFLHIDTPFNPAAGVPCLHQGRGCVPCQLRAARRAAVGVLQRWPEVRRHVRRGDRSARPAATGLRGAARLVDPAGAACHVLACQPSCWLCCASLSRPQQLHPSLAASFFLCLRLASLAQHWQSCVTSQSLAGAV